MIRLTPAEVCLYHSEQHSPSTEEFKKQKCPFNMKRYPEIVGNDCQLISWGF